MNLVTAKCPNCGADINFNPDLDKFTCNACGTTLYNDRNEKIVKIEKHTVDETEIFRIQEQTRRKEERRKRRIKGWKIFGIGIVIYFILVLIDGAIDERNDKKMKEAGMINPPNESCEHKKSSVAVHLLEQAGFTNITVIDLEDKRYEEAGYDDIVKDVTIDGDSTFSYTDWFSPDAEVILYTY